MKCNYKLSLAMIASFAIILPMSVYPKDQNQDDANQGKGQGKGQQQGGKAAPQGAPRVSAQTGGRSHGGNVQGAGRVNNVSSGLAPARQQRSNISPVTTRSVQNTGRVNSASSVQSRANRALNGSAAVQQSNVAPVTSQSVQSGTRLVRGQRTQSQALSSQQQIQQQQQYNSGNNYGGLWFPANTHSDWNRNQQYSWDNHNYRWYQNGWLIIDAGFNPYYSNRGYYSNGSSTVSNVQLGLSRQGYYRGPIDGDFGPGTRNAVANYQGDNGLAVTGRINDPLLQSLGLE